ncbi:MAG: ATP-grasp domain-containing protein [Burkholderiales bacterium]
MRLFVYEHITGGGLLGARLPPALLREGEAMLHALLDDLVQIDALEISILRDFRLPAPPHGVTVRTPHSATAFAPMFDACLAAADAVWPIAPESGGTLEALSLRIQNSGKRLLGSSPDAVHIASSKIATARILASAGIPAVPTHYSVNGLECYQGPVVVKPDDGAGCQQTYYFDDASAAKQWLEARSESGYVVQPYLPGTALSLSLLCRSGHARVLSCNRQRVAVREGMFHFDGTETGAGGDGAAYRGLADAIAHALPGLWGYAGVDFIASKQGPVVLEINPRLTTSYAGLGQAAGVNPARLVLGLADPMRFGEAAMGYAHA